MGSKKSTGYVASRVTPGKEASRYNSGKLRYDLIPTLAQEELALVYTAGAGKYDDNNWRKGMPYSEIIASLERHVAKFKAGSDVDPEFGIHHLSHAAWNCFTLIEYCRNRPNMDDRPHWWLNPPRIGFDLDGVLADFHASFAIALGENGYPDESRRFATHWRSSSTGFWETWNKYCETPEWWLALPSIHGLATDFPFHPVAYITHRTFETAQETTERWLDKWNYPTAQVVATSGSKVDTINELELDIFVDDKFENFQEINTHTQCVCYLWDAPHNRKFPVGGLRIYNLDELAQIVYGHEQRTFKGPTTG